jgi:hypothetical protein
MQPPEAEGAPDANLRHDLLDELLDIVEDVNFARWVRPGGSRMPRTPILIEHHC